MFVNSEHSYSLLLYRWLIGARWEEGGVGEGEGFASTRDLTHLGTFDGTSVKGEVQITSKLYKVRVIFIFKYCILLFYKKTT